MLRLVIFSCFFLATFATSNRLLKPTEQRIVGGHDRNITQVPYQVSVQYEGHHRCGGAIIGRKYILTAAHCFDDTNHKSFSIRAGSNYHDKEGQNVTVVKVICHPHYDSYSGDYDAAVLVLKEPLKFGEGVQNATLASVSPRVGDMALISGWGEMIKGKGAADRLQSVVLPVVSKKICKEKFEPQDEITDRMFCAGYLSGGQDACKGDSGGPALIKGKLAGVVSWGKDCAKRDLPGVYTNIASILSWITAQIQE